MPVHFAAARCALRSPLARILSKRPVSEAANDDGCEVPRPLIDSRTRDALLHFAQYGLDAAKIAAKHADAAAANEDSEAYDRWLGICDALDRKVAAGVRSAVQDDYLIG